MVTIPGPARVVCRECKQLFYPFKQASYVDYHCLWCLEYLKWDYEMSEKRVEREIAETGNDIPWY